MSDKQIKEIINKGYDLINEDFKKRFEPTSTDTEKVRFKCLINCPRCNGECSCNQECIVHGVSQRKRIIEEIEKLIVTTPSGNCPSCISGSNISGYHPHDTLHHYTFYNKALDDIIKVIEKEGKE